METLEQQLKRVAFFDANVVWLYLQVTAKGNPRDVIHMMEDLFKEGFVEVNLGAVVVLKELSENSLKIKVGACVCWLRGCKQRHGDSGRKESGERT